MWIAVEEERRPSLSIANPQSDVAQELIGLRLAQRAEAGLALTPQGHPEAVRAIRRHRLAERLVTDVLAAGEEQMDAHACRLEHALVEGLDETICTLLGHPRYCPHGKPIPEGRCCLDKRDTVGRLITPLRDLKAGQSGHIAYIHAAGPDHTQKLMAMGVLPGVPIRLLQRSPSYVFEAGFSQFAVDEEIASDIYVRTAG
jgi:DtxR family Mn-dependent transcriptional regulator